MAYTRQIWEDLPSENTPVSADSLNHMEEGIESANKVTTVISPTEPTTGEEVWIKKGKNLLNILNSLEGYSSATIVEKTRNSIVLKGDVASYEYLTLKKDLKAGTYAFQRKWELISGSDFSQLGAVIITKDSDNSSLLALNQSTSDGVFTITEDTTIRIVIYLSIADVLTEETQIKVYDIQLEQGETATEFEENVDKEIYVKNDNGVYEEFVKVEEPQYIQVMLTAQKTLEFDGTQYQNVTIPFNKVAFQNGDFSLSDGMVRIGKNINRVKVTLNVMLNTVTTETSYTLSVRVPGTTKAFCYFKLRANSNETGSWIIDVAEGEELFVQFQNQGVATNSIDVYGSSVGVSTSLLIEKIA